jgi:hypothetical protein
VVRLFDDRIKLNGTETLFKTTTRPIRDNEFEEYLYYTTNECFNGIK